MLLERWCPPKYEVAAERSHCWTPSSCWPGPRVVVMQYQNFPFKPGSITKACSAEQFAKFNWAHLDILKAHRDTLSGLGKLFGSKCPKARAGLGFQGLEPVSTSTSAPVWPRSVVSSIIARMSEWVNAHTPVRPYTGCIAENCLLTCLIDPSPCYALTRMKNLRPQLRALCC